MEAVKLGRSRQVVIPKKIHDALGLVPGDYLEVELSENRVVLTPKTLVDKVVEHRLGEALADVRAGRVRGPFKTADAATRSLRGGRKAARK